MALGGLAVAAYQACFFFGVARTGVAVGTVVALGIAPLATGLLGLLLGERPDRRWTLATVGAVAGVVLLLADLRWLLTAQGLLMVLWLGVVATGVSTCPSSARSPA